MEPPQAVPIPQAVNIEVQVNEDLPPVEPLRIETADVTAEKLDLDAQLAMYSGDGSRNVIPGDESPNRNPKAEAQSYSKPDSIGGAFLTPQNESVKPTPITDISIEKSLLMTESIKFRDGVRQGTLQGMLDDIGDPSLPAITQPQPSSTEKINPNPHSAQETAPESKRYSITVRDSTGTPHDNFRITDQPESKFAINNKQENPERAPSRDSINSKSEIPKSENPPPPPSDHHPPKNPDTRDLATMLQSYEGKLTPNGPPANPQQSKFQDNSFEISNTQDETNQKTGQDFTEALDSNTNPMTEINTVD